MSSLSTVEASLPPGFRFHPRDEELICDYLMKWVMMGSCDAQAQQTAPFLIEVDLNKVEPWDIPETACVGGKDWYFYSQRDRKYATGIRTNRATISGYWKATGKDRPIFRKGTLTLVGMRKTLVFYQGRAPKGKKTDWVMHEFRLEGTLGPGTKIIPSSVKEDWVLCRVFYKKSTTQSEVGTAAKQEIITCSSPSLPELVEPNYMINSNTLYHQHPINLDRHHQNYDHQYYQQQVPCFSILTADPNQTNPTFSRIRYSSSNINHHHHHPSPNCNIGSGNHLLPQDDLGNVINNYPASSDHQHRLHADKNHVIKAVLNQYLTKMENINPVNYNDYVNNLPAAAGRADDGKILKDSPISFGDGISSDSYLSEVGLSSSIWNNNFSSSL